jgi:hypothetical protein
LLINKGTLVCILSFRGIIVYNKGVLVYISSSKSVIVCNLGVYSLDLFKWVGYKASDFIEFKGVKGSAFFNLFLDLFLTLFY